MTPPCDSPCCKQTVPQTSEGPVHANSYWRASESQGGVNNIKWIKGQALVESVLALWLLLFTFICVYYTFLLALDKLRALDAVYHAARAYQVYGVTVHGKLPARQSQRVAFWCLGRPSLPAGVQDLSATGPGPQTHEVKFRFLPRTFRGFKRPWETTMWTPGPAAGFTFQSWPNARRLDRPPSAATLLGEALKVQALAALPQTAADALETVDLARRGGP